MKKEPSIAELNQIIRGITKKKSRTLRIVFYYYCFLLSVSIFGATITSWWKMPINVLAVGMLTLLMYQLINEVLGFALVLMRMSEASETVSKFNDHFLDLVNQHKMGMITQSQLFIAMQDLAAKYRQEWDESSRAYKALTKKVEEK